MEAGLINLLKLPPDAFHSTRQPGRVFDPAQAAAEWYQVAATLRKRAARLQVRAPYPKDLTPQAVWQSLAKAADGWGNQGRAHQDRRPGAPWREAAAEPTCEGAGERGRARAEAAAGADRHRRAVLG
eukprot:5344531-Alexandrium_andersonii.AAC.1